MRLQNEIDAFVRQKNDETISLSESTYLARRSYLTSEQIREKYFELKPEPGQVFDANFYNREIVHVAAESHVDRSIQGPMVFVQTNVVGTCQLLDAALEYFQGMTPVQRKAFRFLHISTDEVFGSLGAQGEFVEDTPYAPNSPYAASKAAELMTRVTLGKNDLR